MRYLCSSQASIDIDCCLKSDIELLTLIINAKKFTQRIIPSNHFSAAWPSATTIYTSAMVLTPDALTMSHRYHSQSGIRSLRSGRNVWKRQEVCHGISPDGMRVATSTEHILSVFSVTTGTALWSQQIPSWAGRPFFSSDGQILACGNNEGYVQLFHAASGAVIKKLDVPVTRVYYVAFSPQNEYIAVVVGQDTRTVCIVRIEDGRITWRSNETSTLRVWYIPDGRLANVYHDAQLVNGQTGESLDGFQFAKETAESIGLGNISLSPDNLLLVVSPLRWSAPYPILIWSTRSGRLVAKLEGHKSSIRSINFSYDGKLLVSGSQDLTVRVWQSCSQTQTWICVAVLCGHTAYVDSVAFLPDGKRIISASEMDHTTRIWDISAVLEGKVFDVHFGEGVHAVGAWFRQGICLGGWFGADPFLFQYSFPFPKGVQPLDWGKDTKAGQRVDSVIEISENEDWSDCSTECTEYSSE